MRNANVQTLKPPIGFNIKVKISDVLKEKADACIVPQYDKKISMSGASRSLFYSSAKDGIIALQKHQETQRIPFGSAFLSQCSGKNYSYLIHLSVLGLNKDISSFNALYFATRVALKSAEKEKLNTIVITLATKQENPLLTDEEMSLSIIKAIFDVKKELKHIREITILTQNNNVCEIFCKTLGFINSLPPSL